MELTGPYDIEVSIRQGYIISSIYLSLPNDDETLCEFKSFVRNPRNGSIQFNSTRTTIIDRIDDTLIISNSGGKLVIVGRAIYRQVLNDLLNYYENLR